MSTKRTICEEIGNAFGTFFEDIAGFLVIDDGEVDHIYSTENELLIDWLPKLQLEDQEAGDDQWADIIEYILNLDLD